MDSKVTGLIRSLPPGYDFPAGGIVPLLSGAEMALLAVLQAPDFGKVGDERMSGQLPLNDAYSLVIFAVRVAVYGVRMGKPSAVPCSLSALCMGTEQIDWRDLLGALAIVEDCAARLGLDFQNEFLRLPALRIPEQARGVLTGYFDRPKPMRAVEVFGFKAVGEGESLMYVAV